MRFESFVALRYLAASRRRAHVALIAKISILGLALGVAALIVSLALLEGFQDRIRKQMVGRAHLRVSPTRGVRLAELERGPGSRGDAGSRRRHAGARGPGLDLGRRRDLGRAGALPKRAGPGRRNGPVARVNASAARVHPAKATPIDHRPRVRLAHRADPGGGGGARAARPDDRGAGEGPGGRGVRGDGTLLTGDFTGAGAYEARLADPPRGDAAASLRAALGGAYRVQTWRELNAPLASRCALEKAVISHGRAGDPLRR
jgi:hypothetical protein